MTPAKFDALCRAWHRKTRRPVPTVAVKVGDGFFDPLPDDADADGQKRFAASIGLKHGA